VNFIWESLDLKILGLRFQRGREGMPLESYRPQPGVKEDTVAGFKAWVRALFQLASGAMDPYEQRLPDLPFFQIRWAKIQARESLALVVGVADTPLFPEESELFKIFLMQGEAALNNLELLRDGLTGLYNYRHFWELLAYEIARSRRYQAPLSLLFLDVDNFKFINDTLGHPRGDVVLKTLAAYLQRTLRQTDVVICRYGGEEFVVLMPETNLEQAMSLAERLCHQISQIHIPSANGNFNITVSIGVASLGPEMDGEALVDSADAAMYRAKQAGKNQVCGPEPGPPED
jgi:diguanylate cyclase (GGDEF)-like protein